MDPNVESNPYWTALFSENTWGDDTAQGSRLPETHWNVWSGGEAFIQFSNGIVGPATSVAGNKYNSNFNNIDNFHDVNKLYPESPSEGPQRSVDNLDWFATLTS